MHRATILILAITFVPALASAHTASPEDFSRAHQLARRIASLENNKDLPSRTLGFSQRVARNSHELAVKRRTQAKQVKRLPANQK